MENFAYRLKKFRNYKRLSQEEFVRMVPGINQGNMTQWENSKGKPNGKKTGAIQKYFPDLNMSWLLDGDGEMLVVVKQEPEIAHNDHSLISELMKEKSRLLSIIEKLVQEPETNFPEDSRQAPLQKVWSTIQAAS